MKKAHSLLLNLCGFILLMMPSNQLYGWSSLAKNDPYPIFTTEYPYNWLLNSTKNHLKGIEPNYCPDHFSIAFSGFYQKANRGANYDREKVPLGDLEGRWHMLGMLYGPTGNPGFFPPEFGPALQEAKLDLFPEFGPLEMIPSTSVYNDPNRHVGYFSAPIKYRKHGVRFEMAVQPIEDFGLVIQGGYADIKQTLTLLEDLTPRGGACVPSNIVPGNLTCILMTPSVYVEIFDEQGLIHQRNSDNICDFRQGAFEDVRFGLWVRHIFEINRGCNPCEWAQFLFIPFFQFEGTISGAPQQNRMNFLSVPFDNNGHNSIGFTSGFHIDFYETVEVGFHGGITHFYGKTVNNYRLPTSETQSGIYPFAAPQVFLQPGNNHHFSVMFHAYRFIDKLSFNAEFTFVNHDSDKITLKDPTLLGLFRVEQQECLTKFTSQLLTTGMNYEISPNLQLGLAIQWPIQQRNAYRSTTVIGTLMGTF